MTAIQADPKAVSKAHPCGVCGGTNRCSREYPFGPYGLRMCSRLTNHQPGYVFLGKSRKDEQVSLYRVEGDPELKKSPGNQNGNKPQIDIQERMQQSTKNLTPALRAELAATLGLPENCLGSVPVGYLQEGPHNDFDTGQSLGPCWTFGEEDPAGSTIGITCRYLDNTKKAYPGSSRGLTIPDGWQEQNGDVLLVEGVTGGAGVRGNGSIRHRPAQQRARRFSPGRVAVQPSRRSADYCPR